MAETGRPSKYTPEIAQSIIEQLSDGIALRVICRQENMPAWRTVYHWLDQDKELLAHVTRARALGYEAIAEHCLDIADDSTKDYTESDKGKAFNSEHVQRSKLRVETRMKLLACWASSKYGPKVQVDASLTQTTDLSKLSDAELGQVQAILLAASERKQAG